MTIRINWTTIKDGVLEPDEWLPLKSIIRFIDCVDNIGYVSITDNDPFEKYMMIRWFFHDRFPNARIHLNSDCVKFDYEIMTNGDVVNAASDVVGNINKENFTL